MQPMMMTLGAEFQLPNFSMFLRSVRLEIEIYEIREVHGIYAKSTCINIEIQCSYVKSTA